MKHKKSSKDLVVHNKQTNIIIMSAPIDMILVVHHLWTTKLLHTTGNWRKRMKVYEHVSVVVNLKREHFTRHGLHMNYKGKAEAARTIPSTIDCINNKVSNSIPLQWHDIITRAAQEKVEPKQTSGPSTKSSTCRLLSGLKVI